MIAERADGTEMPAAGRVCKTEHDWARLIGDGVMVKCTDTSGPAFRLCSIRMAVTDLEEAFVNASCQVGWRTPTPTGRGHSRQLGGAVPCATRVRLRIQSRWLRWPQRAGVPRRVGSVRQAGVEGASLLTEQEQEEARWLLG